MPNGVLWNRLYRRSFFLFKRPKSFFATSPNYRMIPSLFPIFIPNKFIPECFSPQHVVEHFTRPQEWLLQVHIVSSTHSKIKTTFKIYLKQTHTLIKYIKKTINIFPSSSLNSSPFPQLQGIPVQGAAPFVPKPWTAPWARSRWCATPGAPRDSCGCRWTPAAGPENMWNKHEPTDEIILALWSLFSGCLCKHGDLFYCYDEFPESQHIWLMLSTHSTHILATVGAHIQYGLADWR